MKYAVQIDSDISCTVILNQTERQSRQIAMRLIGPNMLEITCGYQIKWPQIQSFIFEKRSWILRRIQILNSQIAHCMQVLDPKTHFLFLGKAVPYMIIVQTNSDSHGKIKRQKSRVTFESDMLKVYSSISLNTQQAHDTLNDWAQKQSKVILPARLTKVATELNLHPNKIVIKNQQKRWGSCSSKGNINLNWRLIKCPSAVIEAICVHEIFHLVEMNHSANFWNLVYHRIPDYKVLIKWLNIYHPLIYDTYLDFTPSD